MSELKKIWFKGKPFYVDPKLQELRNTENPHDAYSFEEYCEIRKEVHLKLSGAEYYGDGCGMCQLHGTCEL